MGEDQESSNMDSKESDKYFLLFTRSLGCLGKCYSVQSFVFFWYVFMQDRFPYCLVKRVL